MTHSRTLCLALALLAALAGQAFAGKYNKKVSIGDAAPEFSNLPGVDGKNHSLADFKGKDVVVVVITCNHCPIATDYEDRVIGFARKYATPESKVALVAINVNKGEEDRLPAMKVRAKEKGYPFPYLFDESQEIGRKLGATVTPEFFVLDRDRKIVYMGAMDDSQDASEVKTNYLQQAVEAALKGKKPEPAETRVLGCAVQYERKK